MHSEFAFMCVHDFNTENMRAKINMLEAKQGTETSNSRNADNKTKWQDIESKIIDAQIKYDTARTESQENLQIINSTVEQLSRDIYTNEDRIAMEHTKIEQLEFERTHD